MLLAKCLARQTKGLLKPYGVTTSKITKCMSTIHHNDYPDHKALVLESFGDPKDSISLNIRKASEVLPAELGPDQVVAEHLASPINPADINTIQGVYGIKPNLPSVVGNEGVVRITQVGSNVRHLKVNDLAVGVVGTGYWQSYSIHNADNLYTINKSIDRNVAAQIKVNPCTAYRMIEDFADLKPGDTIIQNGANSAVGVYSIQLAKLWGYKTINVIRDSPNKEKVIAELKDFGADYVLTEAEVSNVTVVNPILKNIGKPKLFLNCVGGKNANDCQRTLDIGGYSVTYGAMSKQPFSVPASPLIFKDHKFVGFWVSRWYEKSQRHEIQAMITAIVDMFLDGTLRPKASTTLKFEDRLTAFGPSNNTKFIFGINNK